HTPSAPLRRSRGPVLRALAWRTPGLAPRQPGRPLCRGAPRRTPGRLGPHAPAVRAMRRVPAGRGAGPFRPLRRAARRHDVRRPRAADRYRRARVLADPGAVPALTAEPDLAAAFRRRPARA